MTAGTWHPWQAIEAAHAPGFHAYTALEGDAVAGASLRPEHTWEKHGRKPSGTVVPSRVLV